MINEELKQTVELVGKAFDAFLESVCLLAFELKKINLVQAIEQATDMEEAEKNKETEKAPKEKMAGEVSITAKEATVAAPIPKTNDEDAGQSEKKLTKEEVRVVLSKVAKAGYRQEVKDLLAKYNAQNLRDVDEKNYAALVAEAEGLVNG